MSVLIICSINLILIERWSL